MSDRVAGMAVRTTGEDGKQRLYILCETLSGRFAGRVDMVAIPVCKRGMPEPESWQYTESGNMLNVTPSVKVTTTYPVGDRMEPVEVFHNAGAWSIPYIDCPSGTSAYEMFCKANAGKIRMRD